MSTDSVLDELHRFFEDDPDDHQLEIEAEGRLKTLYSCLLNATSRTMLQIGLNGLLTYVKASQRSATIDELLLSKDYISEIITMAADHFTTAPLLSATCLHECMLNYPKKFSPFLINKFRPSLPRVIYKKMSGPNEICCKCIAHLSVLGIPSSSKQAKSWKTEYDRYLKIASLLIDQLYSGIGDPLCADINDIEAALTVETGDLISLTDYAAIFCNCASILRYLFYVPLDSAITVSCERTFKLISKVMSLNVQQFNTLQRKQHLAKLLGSCVQLCDTLMTFNPSSFMFNIRSIFTLVVSLLDLVRPQAEYLTLTVSIYQLLTNLFAVFQRQVRIDVDALQKLIRWLINDTTIRARSKTTMPYLSTPDHSLTRAAMPCLEQLINVYSDHMPKDQFSLLQNHCVQTLMTCQASNGLINKPYDEELCRVGLYNMLECLLINERADCSTIIAISKDLIDNASLVDSSVKVKMAVRKLKLIWQQVHDSTNHLYQSWSFLNVDKPRKIAPNQSNSSMTTNDLRHIFVPSSMPMMNHFPASSMMTSEPTPTMHPYSLVPQPTSFSSPMESAQHVFLPPAQPSLPFTSLDLLPKSPPTNRDAPTMASAERTPSTVHDFEQERKRAKIIDTRAVQIDDDDDDDDGAEQIFAEDEEVDDERMEEDEEDDDEIDDDEEIDESDEVDDDGDMREGGESDISSDEDDEERPMKHTNGMKKIHPHLGIHESNVDLLGIHGAPADSYLQAMNDNIHKKFRRHSQHPSATHTALEDISHSHNQISHPVQLNGDHKNNISRPAVANGQGLPTTDAGDDDDIVLVSDDDDDDDDDDDNDSDEKHTEINVSSLAPLAVITSAAQMLSGYADKLTKKSPATTLMAHDASYTKDLLEDIDRTLRDHAIGIELSSVDNSATSCTLAVQETLESLRDAITLVSDDYAVSFGEQH